MTVNRGRSKALKAVKNVWICPKLLFYLELESREGIHPHSPQSCGYAAIHNLISSPLYKIWLLKLSPSWLCCFDATLARNVLAAWQHPGSSPGRCVGPHSPGSACFFRCSFHCLLIPSIAFSLNARPSRPSVAFVSCVRSSATWWNRSCLVRSSYYLTSPCPPSSKRSSSAWHQGKAPTRVGRRN